MAALQGAEARLRTDVNGRTSKVSRPEPQGRAIYKLGTSRSLVWGLLVYYTSAPASKIWEILLSSNGARGISRAFSLDNPRPSNNHTVAVAAAAASDTSVVER